MYRERLDDKTLLSFYDGAVFFGDSIMQQFARFRRQKNETDPEFLNNFKIISASGISLFVGTRRNIIPNTPVCFTYNGMDQTIYDIAKELDAPRIFILLGQNDEIGNKVEKGIKMVEFAITARNDLIPDTEMYFLSCTPVSKGFCEEIGSPEYQKNLDQFNARMKETCEKYDGVYYVEIAEPLKDEDGYLNAAYSTDQFYHINEDAYILLIGNLCDYAQEQYNAGRWIPAGLN